MDVDDGIESQTGRHNGKWRFNLGWKSLVSYILTCEKLSAAQWPSDLARDKINVVTFLSAFLSCGQVPLYISLSLRSGTERRYIMCHLAILLGLGPVES